MREFDVDRGDGRVRHADDTGGDVSVLRAAPAALEWLRAKAED